jgi:hypothetical protein
MKKLKVTVKLVEVKRKHSKKEFCPLTKTEHYILGSLLVVAGICLGTCITLWTI